MKCVHGYAPNGVRGLEKVGVSADAFASLPCTSYPAPGLSDEGLNFPEVSFGNITVLSNSLIKYTGGSIEKAAAIQGT